MFLLFQDRVLHYTPVLSGEFLIFSPQLPKGWDDRCALSHPEKYAFSIDRERDEQDIYCVASFHQ